MPRHTVAGRTVERVKAIVDSGVSVDEALLTPLLPPKFFDVPITAPMIVSIIYNTKVY